MLVLAFDTATPAVTVALHDGTHVLAETTTVDARRHGELLASSIDAVLAEAGAGRLDITAVAAGTGPGPYTGLRAGLVTARVLGSALGVPVYGVCTLDVIAADVAGTGTAAGQEFVVATDARRREVYWARYDAAGRRLDGPAVGFPADVAETVTAETAVRKGGRQPKPTARSPGSPILTAGAGALLYPDVLGGPIEPSYPAAGTLAGIAAQRLAAGEPGSGRRADLPAPPRRPGARAAEAGDGPVTRHDAASPEQPTTPPAATPGITLRAMTPADLPAVLRLETALFGDEAWSEAMLASELEGAEASGRYYLVAEDAGGLVGYAGLLSPDGGQADVLTMAVAAGPLGPADRGPLLDSLLAEAARRGCTEVFLEVRVDNDRAQRLYRAAGSWDRRPARLLPAVRARTRW